MADGAFRVAIAGIIEDRDFALNTPRMEKAKETARKLVEASTANDSRQHTFVKFALAIDKKLEGLATLSSTKKLSTQRKLLWSRFHASRTSELRNLWENLYKSLGLNPKDPLLYEYVNEKLFEQYVKANLRWLNSHQNHLSLQMMTSMLCVMLLALFHGSLRKNSKSQLVIIPIGEITYYA